MLFLTPVSAWHRRSQVWFLALLVLLLGCRHVFPQATLHMIAGTGPVSNRFNVVFLSEAYATNDLWKFVGDAAAAFEDLAGREPFAEYRSGLNAFAIAIGSTNSGSDHPAYGIKRNTYFNSTYDGSDTLITIPTNGTGQGRVDALVKALLPECNVAILLVNDPVAGGSDGFAKTAIVSTGFGAGEILVHEVGHVMAGLGDEYSSAYPGFPDVEEPNTTRQTQRDVVRWSAWIDPSTPVPTPAIPAYDSVVGLFEGAHYHTAGWFRPQLDCAMRSQYVPFCRVCAEALVLSLLRHSRPIDASSPSGVGVLSLGPEPVRFGVMLRQPASHSLTVEWRLDSKVLGAGFATNLVLNPQDVGNGSHRIEAVVRDTTPLVRADPLDYRLQTAVWGWEVVLPTLQSPALLPDGRFKVLVDGHPSLTAVVEGSTNLAHWIPLRTNALAGGPFWFTNDTGWRHGAFRALTRP